MFRYKTVIFDLDGTLLDTLEDLADSVNYALEKYKISERTLEEIKSFVGNGIGKLIERAIPQGLNHPKYEDILETFTQHYKVNCQSKTKPYDGIDEVLNSLKSANIKIGIVSNKADFAVKQLNEYYFGSYHMAAMGEKQGVNRKPAPDTVFEIIKELNANVDSTVYIGDSEVDISTAINAGVHCISVLWGFREREFLESMGGVEFVSTPSELINCLTSI